MSFKSLFKTITKTSALTSLGISSFISLAPEIKAENFNMAACPEPGSANATLAYIGGNLQGQCLHTPEQYILTIYEMGLCTSDPVAANNFDKSSCVETMVSSSGTVVDLAPGSATSKTAALPEAPTRPANNSYTHAYILLGNDFKMKGSYELSDGTTYFSKEEEDQWGKYGAANKTITSAQEHTDLVDNMYFGDDPNGWDGVMTATAMPGGGSVSALLLKECTGATCTGANGLATTQGEVKRLLGVFQANAGAPVVITDATEGVEVELVVKSDPNNPNASGGGYLIMGWDNGDGNGFDLRGFGSAPFKPKFTTF